MKGALKAAAATLAGVLLLAAGGVAWLFADRPGLAQYAAHRYEAAAASGPQLTATWLGTTAVLLSDGAHSLIVDPFFTRPAGWWNLLRNARIAPDEALIARWLAQLGLKSLDAVLVGHSHYDHALDAGVVARLAGAALVGSASTANIGRSSGVPEAQLRVVAPGQPQRYGPYTVTFFASRHAGATGGKPTGDITQPLRAPARYLDYKQGGTYSILIEHPLGTVLHHGSAGFVPGALQGRHADVVLLGIALREDLDAYLREVVDAVGAKRVIPTHWDDFTRPLDEPLRPGPFGVRLDAFFHDMARLRPDLKVQTLEAGRTVAVLP